MKAQLHRCAELIDRSLSESTGLNAQRRKIVGYWTLAAHALLNCRTFALLVLLGKMGCGKSQTLSIIENFARQPHRMSLRGMTLPSIRDKLAAASEGTAIVEEADFAWRDSDSTFERLLSDRYSRDAAAASYRVPTGEKSKAWETKTQKFFGATVLHRRIPFNDAAMDGRTITVHFRPKNDREYREFSAEDPWNKEGKELVSGLDFELPPIDTLPGIAGRIQATYSPLLRLAKLLGDVAFIDEVTNELILATAELKEAQGTEPDGLVLRAILHHIYSEPNPFSLDGSPTELSDPVFTNIKISSLNKTIWEENRITLNPRQIGGIARGLGFEVKVSNGVTVISPTPATLLRACESCEYSDPSIENLKASMKEIMLANPPDPNSPHRTE